MRCHCGIEVTSKCRDARKCPAYDEAAFDPVTVASLLSMYGKRLDAEIFMMARQGDCDTKEMRELRRTVSLQILALERMIEK